MSATFVGLRILSRVSEPSEFLSNCILDARPFEEFWVCPRPKSHRIGEGELAKTLRIEETMLNQFPRLLEHPSEVWDVPVPDVAGKESGYAGSERVQTLVKGHGSHRVV